MDEWALNIFIHVQKSSCMCSLHSSTVPHSSWKSTLIQISKYINIDNYAIYNFNAILCLFKNPQEGYLTSNSNLWSRLIRTGGGSFWGSFELLGWTESAWRFSAPLKQCLDMGRWLEPRKYLGDCQVERHLPKHVVLGFRVWKGCWLRKVGRKCRWSNFCGAWNFASIRF